MRGAARLAAALLAAGLAASPVAHPAWAVSDPAEMLPDPAQEARAQSIGRGLRCLVCQNESIEDSGADLARDLRRIVRQRVAAGDDQPAVEAWMTSRYGDFVRLRPPFDAGTAILWGTPALAILAGLGAAWAAGRRTRRTLAPPAPLSDSERQRLSDLA